RLLGRLDRLNNFFEIAFRKPSLGEIVGREDADLCLSERPVDEISNQVGFQKLGHIKWHQLPPPSIVIAFSNSVIFLKYMPMKCFALKRLPTPLNQEFGNCVRSSSI